MSLNETVSCSENCLIVEAADSEDKGLIPVLLYIVCGILGGGKNPYFICILVLRQKKEMLIHYLTQLIYVVHFDFGEYLPPATHLWNSTKQT